MYPTLGSSTSMPYSFRDHCLRLRRGIHEYVLLLKSVKLEGPKTLLAECLQDVCSLLLHPTTPLVTYTWLKKHCVKKRINHKQCIFMELWEGKRSLFMISILECLIMAFNDHSLTAHSDDLEKPWKLSMSSQLKGGEFRKQKKFYFFLDSFFQY